MGRCTNHPEKTTSYVCLKHNIYMCENCRNTECIIKQALPHEEINLDLLLEKLEEIEKRPLKIQEEFMKKIQYLTYDKHTRNLAKLEKI